MPTPPESGHRRLRTIAAGAAAIAIALAIAPDPASAKRDIDVLHEISNLEDRRTLGEGRLFELLRDAEPETRAAAARALGRIGREEGVDPLLEALSDSDETVRLEAIFALGQIGDEAARDALRRIAGSNVSVEERTEAILALGKLPGEGAAEAVLPFLADPVAAVRADAAIALARTADSVAALDLRPLLADPDPRVRADAAWAVGRLEAESLADDLRPLLDGADPGVKLAATKSVGQVEDVEAIRPLSLLAHDPDWRVRVNVANSLGRMKTLDALPGIAVLSKDENSNVRTAAAQALLDIPYHFKKDDVVYRLLHDPEPQVRAAVMQPMGRGLEDLNSADEEHWASNADSSTAVVLAAYESFADASRRVPLETPTYRVWQGGASFYLRGRLQNPEAPLAEKVAAAYHLGAFQTALPRRYLLEALSQVHWAVTAAAIHALGELTPKDTTDFRRHKEETPRIFRQILERDPEARTEVDIRLAIAEALGEFDRDDAKELARELAAGDPDYRVRREAADSLEKLGEPRPEVAPPGPLPGDPEPLDDEYLELKPGKLTATLVTSKGEIVIELFNREAPRTVQSFVELARKGFYDGLIFHRVVPNFVIQGGCPIGNGWGHPGYELRCEYNRLRYERGMVGMAHAGKDTGGSQFFVTHSRQPHLDGRYTIFGRVVEGMDVVDRIRVEDVIESVEVKKKFF
jgi:peptidylprolyl isomerase